MRTIVHDVESDSCRYEGERNTGQQVPWCRKHIECQQDVECKERYKQDSRLDENPGASVNRGSLLFEILLNPLLKVGVEV